MESYNHLQKLKWWTSDDGVQRMFSNPIVAIAIINPAEKESITKFLAISKPMNKTIVAIVKEH